MTYNVFGGTLNLAQLQLQLPLQKYVLLPELLSLSIRIINILITVFSLSVQHLHNLMHQICCDPAPGSTDWMTHCYGTSVHVRLLQVKSKNLLHCKELSCECFVHLNEISIAPVIVQPHRCNYTEVECSYICWCKIAILYVNVPTSL